MQPTVRCAGLEGAALRRPLVSSVEQPRIEPVSAGAKFAFGVPGESWPSEPKGIGVAGLRRYCRALPSVRAGRGAARLRSSKPVINSECVWMERERPRSLSILLAVPRRNTKANSVSRRDVAHGRAPDAVRPPPSAGGEGTLGLGSPAAKKNWRPTGPCGNSGSNACRSCACTRSAIWAGSEWIVGATGVLDGDPTLLGERLDAGRAAELAVAGVLDPAEGSHGFIADALIVDVDDP